MAIFRKGWSNSDRAKVQRLEHPKYELYTIKGHLIESSVVKRYMRFRHVIESHGDFKLDHQSLEVAFREMEKAIDNNQLAAVSQWIGLLRALKDLTYWENELFEVCNCFIFLPGEPIDDFSSEYTIKKRAMYDADPELKLFFCQFGHEYLRHIQDLPENTNVLEYLETRQNLIAKKTYERLILRSSDKSIGIS